MATYTKQVGARTVHTGLRVRQQVGKAVLLVVVILTALLFIGPFLWTVGTSLKAYGEVYTFPPTLLPKVPQWENYYMIFTMVPFPRFIYNTVVITVLTVLGATSSSILVGYSFSRFRWPGRDFFFIVCLGTMMLPVEVTLIPTYILFSKLKWIDTWKPLIVPHWFGGGAFNVFLMRQFFMSLPRDLDEAALIDGAGPLRILWQVLLPLCKPVITTVVVINFIGSWNDFMGPLIFLNSTEKYTVSIGIRWFSGEAWKLAGYGRPTEHLMMGASVVATFPCVLLYAVAQRYFVQGIVTTGLKGAGV